MNIFGKRSVADVEKVVERKPFNPAIYKIGFCGSCHYYKDTSDRNGFCWRFPASEETNILGGCGEWTKHGTMQPYRWDI